jgi:NAD(P)-dependent dehydrogenase (short-subunit alcohol dehydrogenase family)
MHKVALITGGTSGVGLASAIRFARANFDVAICGRDPSRLARAKASIVAENSQIKCLEIAADLCDRTVPRKIATEFAKVFGRIDVLVNNAGYASNMPFPQITEAEYDRTMESNARSVFFLTQAVWPMMVSQHQGVIVNISSLAAVSPFPGFAVYGSSKAWLDLFTIAIANEGKASGIRAYSIRPGAVETPMLRGLFPDFPSDQTVSPEAVADVVWAVTQDEFRFSSGQAIAVTRQ